MTDAFAPALIAELAKKTGVCWLRYEDPDHPGAAARARPAWHVWHDDALHLVAGGDEQPLPGLEDAGRVEVLMRSKDNGGRLLSWVGSVSVLAPSDAGWDEATAALVSGRLNLPDLGTAAGQWAEHSVVVRVDPTGELRESPGDLSDDAHLVTPAATPAATRGALPRVLHRRQRRRPKLT